ncbi:hypothetical protein R3P38DRAFT_3183080 [Favolaschia claudopus]|uniref:F-box domain-containing protein n=1 Tax=Favolaschia claudopus TaxID=2862362 RepID=A0AAV9ZRT5_9AGAR
MSLTQTLPIELVLEVLDRLIDGDRSTLAACSLVCRTWLAVVRPRLFSDVTLSVRQVDTFGTLKIALESTVLAHTKTVRATGFPRVPHRYPATSQDLRHSLALSQILATIPHLLSLHLGPMHFPIFSPWPVTLVRLCFDSVVMLDIMNLVKVLSQSEFLEDLQLHAHSIQPLPSPIIAASAVLQSLKHLNCRYINDQQFFTWFISISPRPPLVSLSLGKRMFPHNPGALQLIRSASATLELFKTEAILRQEDYLSGMFSSHRRLRTVRLFVDARYDLGSRIFPHRKREDMRKEEGVAHEGSLCTAVTLTLE